MIRTAAAWERGLLNLNRFATDYVKQERTFNTPCPLLQLSRAELVKHLEKKSKADAGSSAQRLLTTVIDAKEYLNLKDTGWQWLLFAIKLRSASGGPAVQPKLYYMTQVLQYMAKDAKSLSPGELLSATIDLCDCIEAHPCSTERDYGAISWCYRFLWNESLQWATEESDQMSFGCMEMALSSLLLHLYIQFFNEEKWLGSVTCSFESKYSLVFGGSVSFNTNLDHGLVISPAACDVLKTWWSRVSIRLEAKGKAESTSFSRLNHHCLVCVTDMIYHGETEISRQVVQMSLNDSFDEKENVAKVANTQSPLRKRGKPAKAPVSQIDKEFEESVRSHESSISHEQCHKGHGLVSDILNYLLFKDELDTTAIVSQAVQCQQCSLYQVTLIWLKAARRAGGDFTVPLRLTMTLLPNDRVLIQKGEERAFVAVSFVVHAVAAQVGSQVSKGRGYSTEKIDQVLSLVATFREKMLPYAHIVREKGARLTIPAIVYNMAREVWHMAESKPKSMEFVTSVADCGYVLTMLTSLFTYLNTLLRTECVYENSNKMMKNSIFLFLIVQRHMGRFAPIQMWTLLGHLYVKSSDMQQQSSHLFKKMAQIRHEIRTKKVEPSGSDSFLETNPVEDDVQPKLSFTLIILEILKEIPSLAKNFSALQVFTMLHSEVVELQHASLFTDALQLVKLAVTLVKTVYGDAVYGTWKVNVALTLLDANVQLASSSQFERVENLLGQIASSCEDDLYANTYCNYLHIALLLRREFIELGPPQEESAMADKPRLEELVRLVGYSQKFAGVLLKHTSKIHEELEKLYNVLEGAEKSELTTRHMLLLVTELVGVSTLLNFSHLAVLFAALVINEETGALYGVGSLVNFPEAKVLYGSVLVAFMQMEPQLCYRRYAPKTGKAMLRTIVRYLRIPEEYSSLPEEERKLKTSFVNTYAFHMRGLITDTIRYESQWFQAQLDEDDQESWECWISKGMLSHVFSHFPMLGMAAGDFMALYKCPVHKNVIMDCSELCQTVYGHPGVCAHEAASYAFQGIINHNPGVLKGASFTLSFSSTALTLATYNLLALRAIDFNLHCGHVKGAIQTLTDGLTMNMQYGLLVNTLQFQCKLAQYFTYVDELERNEQVLRHVDAVLAQFRPPVETYAFLLPTNLQFLTAKLMFNPDVATALRYAKDHVLRRQLYVDWFFAQSVPFRKRKDELTDIPGYSEACKDYSSIVTKATHYMPLIEAILDNFLQECQYERAAKFLAHLVGKKREIDVTNCIPNVSTLNFVTLAKFTAICQIKPVREAVEKFCSDEHKSEAPSTKSKTSEKTTTDRVTVYTDEAEAASTAVLDRVEDGEAFDPQFEGLIRACLTFPTDRYIQPSLQMAALSELACSSLDHLNRAAHERTALFYLLEAQGTSFRHAAYYTMAEKLAYFDKIQLPKMDQRPAIMAMWHLLENLAFTSGERGAVEFYKIPSHLIELDSGLTLAHRFVGTHLVKNYGLRMESFIVSQFHLMSSSSVMEMSFHRVAGGGDQLNRILGTFKSLIVEADKQMKPVDPSTKSSTAFLKKWWEERFDYDTQLSRVLKYLGRLLADVTFNNHDAFFLLLDNSLHILPWEAAICARENIRLKRTDSSGNIEAAYENISRLVTFPSYMYYTSMYGKDKYLPLMYRDVGKVSFLLDPGDNLPRTKERFEDAFNAFGWTGCAGVAPSEDEFKQYLNSDCVIYCGHGTSQQFLSSHRLARHYTEAFVLLFGCSSARVNCYGRNGIAGHILSYMLAGTPAVLGMLWTVTDKEVDVFSERLVNAWFRESPSNPDAQAMIASHIQRLRPVHKLKNISGAAPVIYGLPIFSRKKNL